MSKTLKARITEALVQGEKACKSPGAYPFLPEIQETLKAMLAGLARTQKERERLAAALGRLATEDFGFSESQLGTTLLELADDFASRKE